MTAVGRPRVLALAGVPVVVPAAIAIAWALAIMAQAANDSARLHHDALIHSSLPRVAALAVFLVAWQAMIAAMMLPSSVPLVRLFARASVEQPRPGFVMAAFLGGYAAVWSAFGAVAFMADVGVHATVDSVPWLARHDWLIAGTTLAIAGAFQFSSLKDACLRECRHPGAFLLSRYDRGPGAAFRLGRAHGIYCLGCCWALMLVMFGAGVASLWWMGALTALMVYEKTASGGRTAVPLAGVALLLLAGLAFAHPAGLPNLLAAN
jgi:predicted metal-binding membrane protein